MNPISLTVLLFALVGSTAHAKSADSFEPAPFPTLITSARPSIPNTDGTPNATTASDGQVYRYQYDNLARRAPQAIYAPGAGVDEPLMRQSGTGAGAIRQFYHQDGLGSAVALSNAPAAGTAATLSASQRFDPWGNTAAASGTLPQYGYTGREPDGSGLIYYRARYYDPSLGRFTQRDPIGIAGGINPYAYVGNNPINYTDPSGLMPPAPRNVDPNGSYATPDDACVGEAPGNGLGDAFARGGGGLWLTYAGLRDMPTARGRLGYSPASAEEIGRAHV